MASRHERNNQRPPLEESKIRPERAGNQVHIYKPEEIYTIIYGNHFASQNPKQLPEKIDGLFLELSANYLKTPCFYLQALAERHQYQNLFKPLAERQIPIYFADLGFKKFMLTTSCFSEGLLEMGEVSSGIRLFDQSIKKIKTTPISRRRLLKEGVRLAAATWLSAPVISDLSIILSNLTGAGEHQAAEFAKLSQRLHPEQKLFIIKLRNTLIAHKEEWLMKHLATQPHFATILAGMHPGIEDQIQHSAEDRYKFLQSLKPILERMIIPETFYKMVRFDFDGRMWQVAEIIEVPELKGLVTS